MKNRRINLLDIGLDQAFDASMTFVQSTIANINAGYDEPFVDVDFVRSRDPHVVKTAFTASCDVLHVMAHGDADQNPTFSSSDAETEISLADLGTWCADTGYGIGASAVIADGCRTGTGVWQRAVRDCLRGPVVYIGTSANIGWHESTVFCGALYGSLFRSRGKGIAPGEQVAQAALKASDAYRILTGHEAPFRVTELKPSRAAIRAKLG